MRISDWSSDVCSSDLRTPFGQGHAGDVIGRVPDNHGSCSVQTGPDHRLLLPQGTASIVQILRAKELPHGDSDRMDHPEVFQKFLTVIGKVLVDRKSTRLNSSP